MKPRRIKYDACPGLLCTLHRAEGLSGWVRCRGYLCICAIPYTKVNQVPVPYGILQLHRPDCTGEGPSRCTYSIALTDNISSKVLHIVAHKFFSQKFVSNSFAYLNYLVFFYTKIYTIKQFS